ncbi:7778_t:CDS:2, partial [Entrophospora sp. SA101]
KTYTTTTENRSTSAEEAITNVLYNMSTTPSSSPKRHALNCLVQNKFNVLGRISADPSRMIVVLRGQDVVVVEQSRRQLEDLVCTSTIVLDYNCYVEEKCYWQKWINEQLDLIKHVGYDDQFIPETGFKMFHLNDDNLDDAKPRTPSSVL